nr:MAG TPA: hypothetical protein [Caudoviricetes sp.]
MFFDIKISSVGFPKRRKLAVSCKRVWLINRSHGGVFSVSVCSNPLNRQLWYSVVCLHRPLSRR